MVETAIRFLVRPDEQAVLFVASEWHPSGPFYCNGSLASDRPAQRQQSDFDVEARETNDTSSVDDFDVEASETKEARSLADFEKQLYKRANALVDNIESNLLEDVRDSDLDTSDIPWQTAISACVDLSAKLSLFLADHFEVKSAAFVDEGGGVSLVLQSIETKRRVNFLIEPDGLAANVCQLDEGLALTHSRVELMDSQATRECAEWVTIKAK